MKRNPASLVLGALAVLFIGSAAAPAQEAVSIKLKELAEGESAQIKKKEAYTTKVKVADGDGNVIVDKNEAKTVIQEYKETVHKRQPGKSATKLERAYSKSQVVQDDDTSEGPLHGKTVIIEKKGDEYTFTYKDGAEVAGKALEALVKDFSKKSENNAEIEKLVLPKGPVKVGQTWKIEMPKIVDDLAKQGDMKLDADKATGQGTLVKTYKKNGRQYGEMKIKMDLPVSAVGKGVEALKFSAGAKIALDLTLDVCIDGTADAGTMKMKMLMSGTAPVGVGMTATLDVIVDATQIQEEAAKK